MWCDCRVWIGLCLGLMDVMVHRVHSGWVVLEHILPATMIRMAATSSLKYMEGQCHNHNQDNVNQIRGYNLTVTE